jgi:hypothetical protein
MRLARAICVLLALLWTPLQKTATLKDINARFNVFSTVNFSRVCRQAFYAVRVICWLFCHVGFPLRFSSLANVLSPHGGLLYRSQMCLKEGRCPLREHVRECVCRFSFNYLGNCQLWGKTVLLICAVILGVETLSKSCSSN